MTRTKELADVLRDCAAMTVQPSSISRKEALELAAICDRLHAIESATPDEVGQIERLHSAKLTRLLIEAGPVIAKEADKNRATLLAIVARQAGEIAEQANGLDEYDGRVQRLRNDLGTAAGVDVFVHAKQVVAERDIARAEVERLTECLRMMQHGEAEALKMMAAEKKRADNAESDLRMVRDDWEAMRSTASAEYKGWKMFRGTHEGAAHSHRCDTCGFTWQHSASQVSRMGAAGKVRVHRCQNCGAMQRFIDDAEPEQQIAPPVGQAGGEPERWDKNLPSTQIPAYLCAACTLEVEVGETFGFCPKCSKPLEMNPRWVAETPEVEQMAKQQEPAEVPRWSGCHANRDGDCNWTDCPQAHDGEPARSGRSCPLWTGEDES